MGFTTSFRLPEHTRGQLLRLCEERGMTQTQVLIVAIDRLAMEELSNPVGRLRSSHLNPAKPPREEKQHEQ